MKLNFIIVVLIVEGVAAVIHYPIQDNEGNRELGRKYSQMVKGIINAVIDRSKISVSQQSSQDVKPLLSPQCEAEINATIDAAGSFIPWAVATFMSWGRPNSLQFEQDQYWEGGYDTCAENKDLWRFVPGLPVQYCAVEWISDRIVQFNGPLLDDGVGLCLPKSCTKQDVLEFFVTGVNFGLLDAPSSYPEAQNISVYCPPTHEETVEKFKKDPAVIGALCVLGFFVLWAMIGTIYDTMSMYKFERQQLIRTVSSGHVNGGCKASVSEKPIDNKETCKQNSSPIMSQWKPNTFGKILLAFSIRKNTPTILNFKQPRGSITCLHGIRFLTMAWILIGHTHQLGIFGNKPGPNVAAVGRFSFVGKADHAVITQMPISVDTFFVLSALLTTLSFLSKLEKKKPNCEMMGRYFFHRFWRLTPVYMMILMVFTTLCEYGWSGPFFRPEAIKPIQTCKTQWWANLIYLNNMPIVDNTNSGCMGWTWYLANDFQFYVFAPVLLFPLFYMPSVGLSLTALCAVGGLVARGVLHHRQFVVAEAGFDAYQEIYIRPWARCTTYFMGIFLGYLLYKKRFNIRMHTALVAVLWILALGAISACFYGTLDRGNWSPQGMVAWETLQRVIFCLGVCWIILACSTGHGGFINSILSWDGWLPLARLSYTAYLIHPIINVWYTGARSLQIYPSNWLFIYWSLGALMLTLGFSFIASLMFEVPFGNLEKLMFENAGSKSIKMNGGVGVSPDSELGYVNNGMKHDKKSLPLDDKKESSTF